jgi:hypothetical protein
MAPRRNLTTIATAEDDTIIPYAHGYDPDDDAVVHSTTIEIKDDLVSARIKGTWQMTWGTEKFDFEDGKRFRIPRELFQYLKKSGNVYDTL